MGSNRIWYTMRLSQAGLHWITTREVGGAKVMRGAKDPHSPSPFFSYEKNGKIFRENSTGKISQLRLFKGHNPSIDIEWGKSFPKLNIQKGNPYMYKWHYNSLTGHMERKGPIPLSPYMIKRYGNLLKLVDVKIPNTSN